MKEEWRLLNLNALPGIETQTIYHAVGLAMENYPDIPNTIILCWPKNPLVCVGYHQIIDEEIDIEYCKKKNLPIVRRTLGGGAVYLDEGQLFYQLISDLYTGKMPKNVEKLYKQILQAPVKTYQMLGINAKYAPINDIEANGKKISGNGAAQIGGGRILTGNLIFDFNYDEMVKVLKVPDEKFRDKVAKSLRERLGTIKSILGKLPDREEVKKILIKNFEDVLEITLHETDRLTDDELKINEELKLRYQNDEWLNYTFNRRSELMSKRKVKISEKRQLYKSIYKAPGGLIRLFLEIEKNKIKDIMISGDFSCDPIKTPEILEKALIGSKVNKESLLQKIQLTYKEKKLDIAGVLPEDIIKVIELSIKDLF